MAVARSPDVTASQSQETREFITSNSGYQCLGSFPELGNHLRQLSARATRISQFASPAQRPNPRIRADQIPRLIVSDDYAGDIAMTDVNSVFSDKPCHFIPLFYVIGATESFCFIFGSRSAIGPVYGVEDGIAFDFLLR